MRARILARSFANIAVFLAALALVWQRQALGLSLLEGILAAMALVAVFKGSLVAYHHHSWGRLCDALAPGRERESASLELTAAGRPITLTRPTNRFGGYAMNTVTKPAPGLSFHDGARVHTGFASAAWFPATVELEPPFQRGLEHGAPSTDPGAPMSAAQWLRRRLSPGLLASLDRLEGLAIVQIAGQDPRGDRLQGRIWMRTERAYPDPGDIRAMADVLAALADELEQIAATTPGERSSTRPGTTARVVPGPSGLARSAHDPGPQPTPPAGPHAGQRSRGEGSDEPPVSLRYIVVTLAVFLLGVLGSALLALWQGVTMLSVGVAVAAGVVFFVLVSFAVIKGMITVFSQATRPP